MLKVLYFISSLLTIKGGSVYIPASKTPPDCRSGITTAYIPSKNIIVMFGGLSGDTFYDDFWSFSIASLTWEEIYPTSEINPSPRAFYGSFVTLHTENFYIFGGCNAKGMKNDLWEFNINYLNWKLISTINPPSARYSFACVFYIERSIEYFAIFGGNSIQDETNDLNILNLLTFEWKKLVNYGNTTINASNTAMAHFGNCFYLTCGTGCTESVIRTFKYCLYEKLWVELTNINENQPSRGYNSGFILDKYFYLFSGGLSQWFEPVIRLDLEGGDYLWAEVEHLPLLAKENYGLTLIGNTAYIMGGYDYAYLLYSNEVQSIDMNSGYLSELSHAFTVPEKRLKASMVTINNELYLFGGVNKNILYNNLWIFNIANEKWRLQNVSGDVPSPRHSHAADSDGDVMAVFGGEDSSGLNGELFLYNSLSYTWKKIIPISIAPRPTKGACLSLKFSSIYIYGGITSTGTTDDFWGLNIIISAYVSMPKNKKVAYMTCYLLDEIFYTLGGIDENGMSSYDYSIFDFTSFLWESIQHNNSITNGIQVMLNKTYINIGGQIRLQELTKKIVVVDDNLTSYVLYKDYPYVYFSAFSYYKSRIYSFGGGYNQGKFPLHLIGTNNFFYIDIKEICSEGICEAKCSKGTYNYNNRCVECDAGYYKDTIGNTLCNPCPPGTYSIVNGTNSYGQCYPCPSGSYNDIYGSKICLDCPASFNCPWGSKEPIDGFFSSDLESIQPKMYVSPSSRKNIIIYTVSTVMSFVAIFICIISFEKLRKILIFFDIYTDKHNHELLAPMTLKKNTIGGIFSVLFIVVAIVFIGSAIIDFQMSSIQESKSIIPLTLFENEIKNFTNPELNVSIQIIGISLSCELFFQVETIINGTKRKHYCKNLSGNGTGNGIEFSFYCNDCFISGESIFFLQFLDASYASAIYVKITSSSSIPNEVSSLKSELYPDKGHMFMGSGKSEFFFTFTPSLFVSELSYWPSPLTGYHISNDKLPIKGSQGLITDLPVNLGLNILITIYENQFGLYTQRIRKQSFFILMSGVIGSVFGIMDIIAFIMKFIEGFYLSIKKKLVKKKSLSMISSKRKHIKNVCFIKHPKKVKGIEDFEVGQSKIENEHLV
ncbi:hypothetical protein SteCoe_27920 [Stentor coeruleus]|uniref:Tyrosine-protein kinase ephrin type A/B receptor-like domain-containing protein n=1 Tax=Stentor coeruleus TaxID=5963 RepID=A0A1R2B9E3_9CILI|nr:hypothetical protein SteCoe_27920 [Stentor coeruleus]